MQNTAHQQNEPLFSFISPIPRTLFQTPRSFVVRGRHYVLKCREAARTGIPPDVAVMLGQVRHGDNSEDSRLLLLNRGGMAPDAHDCKDGDAIGLRGNMGATMDYNLHTRNMYIVNRKG